MRNQSVRAVLPWLILLAFLAACAPSGGQTQPPQPTPGGGQATAAPAPVATTSWDQIVAAANQEGHVSLVGQSGTTVNDALVDAFQSKYPGIQVDLTTGVNGAEVATKVLTERQAGQFTEDLAIHGTNTLLNLGDSQALDPIAPYLVGPDDSDPTVWRGGHYNFADDAQQTIIMLVAGAATPWIYNPQMMSPSDIHSWKDLLDPKWKGKLAMLDPRTPGAGLGMATFWYGTPSLGKDYIQQLATQDPALTTDDLELSNWVAHGEYAAGVGTSDFQALALKEQGVPLEFFDPAMLQEGTYLTAGWASVAVMNRAPHPNAAKVYLNWLMSQDGQNAIVKASGYASRRSDVSTAGLRDGSIPKPGVQYLENSNEDQARVQFQVVDYMKSVLPQ